MGFTGAGGVAGNDAFTKILLHMDGANGSTTFQDVAIGASTSRLWTAAGAAVDSAAGKFSGGMKGSYITTPAHSDFDLGSGLFAVDFWVNLSGSGGTYYLAGPVNSGGSAGAHDFLVSGGAIYFHLWVGSTPYELAGPNIASAGLVHVAAGRTSASTILLFVNGVQQAARTDLAGQSANSTVFDYRIGNAIPSSVIIDEYRLSVGTARWNSNFTPPIAQYI